MPLTDTRIRNAKPTGKSYKLSDGGGMYLLVTPDGARYWRLDYRFAGKRRTLAFGVWWEAIVLARDGDVLTLKWRDYQQPNIVRHAGSVALLKPGPVSA